MAKRKKAVQQDIEELVDDEALEAPEESPAEDTPEETPVVPEPVSDQKAFAGGALLSLTGTVNHAPPPTFVQAAQQYGFSNPGGNTGHQ